MARKGTFWLLSSDAKANFSAFWEVAPEFGSPSLRQLLEELGRTSEPHRARCQINPAERKLGQVQQRAHKNTSREKNAA